MQNVLKEFPEKSNLFSRYSGVLAEEPSSLFASMFLLKTFFHAFDWVIRTMQSIQISKGCPPLFQIRRFTKKCVVLSSDFVEANKAYQKYLRRFWSMFVTLAVRFVEVQCDEIWSVNTTERILKFPSLVKI